MRQLTESEAQELYDRGVHAAMSWRQIASTQLAQDCLFMPFDVFHSAVERTLGRPVQTMEFAFARNSMAEQARKICAPLSVERLMELAALPAETVKR